MRLPGCLRRCIACFSGALEGPPFAEGGGTSVMSALPALHDLPESTTTNASIFRLRTTACRLEPRPLAPQFVAARHSNNSRHKDAARRRPRANMSSRTLGKASRRLTTPNWGPRGTVRLASAAPEVRGAIAKSSVIQPQRPHPRAAGASARPSASSCPRNCVRLARRTIADFLVAGLTIAMQFVHHGSGSPDGR